MKQGNEEETIPLGIVFMSVGLIVVLTAVVAFAIITLVPPQSLACVMPAAVPTQNPNQESDDIALLPETPLEENEDNIISFEDAARPYVNGQPERILIPDIDLDAPVNGIGLAQVINEDKTYYQWQVPADFIAGWHNTSAPLGKTGNTVLNGHHNINGEVFRDLNELEEGAEIFIYDQNQVFTYTVSLVEILPERDQPLAVRMENAEWIAPTEDERITLVTCWPYEDNSHRVVVVAYPEVQNSELLSGAISQNGADR